MGVTANVGFATLSVIPSLQGFEGALKSQVGGPINSVAGEAGAEASQSFGSRFHQGLTSVASQAGKIIAAGFAVGAAGAAVLGGALIKTGVAYNTLEQSSLAAFKTILGSNEAAIQMQDSIRKFALTSPFPRQAFIEGTQQLLGFGVSAEQIIPTLSAIQDSVAAIGGNANDISQVTFALAEVKGQGKLTGETLNQLGQFGIDAASILGEQFGKTSAEIRDMASKPGGIPADQVFDPLVKGLTEKFGGAAAGLKNTFTGALDRVKGAFRDIGSDLAEPFVSKRGGGAAVEWANTLADIMRKLQTSVVPVLAAALANLATRITPFVNRFRDFITNLSTEQIQGFLKRVFDGFDKIRDLFGKIGPLVAGAFSALGTFGASGLPFIGPLLSGISPLLAGFVAVAATSPAIRDAFKSILPIAARLAKTLGSALAPVLPVIAGAIGDVAGFVADLIAAGIEALAPIFSAIVEAVVPLIPIFTDLVTSLRGPLLDVIQTLTPVLTDLAETLGGALADAVKEIAPVLPGLAKTLGEVAVSVGTSLADALISLAPALPAFAELVRIGAELIAKVPPEVLAAIVLGFLAFRGVNEIAGGVGTFAGKLDLLKTSILGIGTNSDGTRTAIGKLIDKIGDLAARAVEKIAVKIGIDVTGDAAAGGLSGVFSGILSSLTASAGEFFAAHALVIGATGIIALVITGITYSIANNSSPQDIKWPDFIGGNLLPTSHEISDAIAGVFTDSFNAAWQAFWRDAPSIDVSVIGGWITDSFSSLDIPNPATFATNVGKTINDIADGIWQAIQDAWSSFWDGIPGFSWSDVWDSVLNFFENDSSGGSGTGGGGGSGTTLAAIDPSFLDDAFQSVFDWFGDLPNKISDALPDPFNWIKDKGVAVITGFISGIGEGVLQIAQFVIGLPAAISDWIGDTGTTLLQKGLDLIGGFLGGIANKAVEVAAFIIGLPAKIVGWLGNTGFTLIAQGVSLIGGFFGGILARINDVANWFFGLKDRIPGWLGNVGGILVEAGRKIMGGLKDGLEAGLGAVGKFLGGVADYVIHHKPIATDHLILLPAGLAIMEGLANGLEKGLVPVQAQLDKTTALFANAAFATPSVDFGKVVPAPSISQRDLAALQSLSIEATATAPSTKTTNINVQALEPGTPLARAISREQAWDELTSGRDD